MYGMVMTRVKEKNKAGKRGRKEREECFGILDRAVRENLTERVRFEQKYDSVFIEFIGKYGGKEFFDMS